MSNQTIHDKIISIHDQTMSRLRALNIPPYPNHYKKYFDEIFMEQADPTLIKAQKNDDSGNDVHSNMSKYVDIANRSITAFTETHADISEAVGIQDYVLKKQAEQGNMHCVALIQEISGLSRKMSEELQKAQEKIDRLNTELDHALAELTTDPLTQISNRKGLYDDLENAIVAGRSKQLPMVVMMLDADNFKALNDTYGHLAGDKVLYFLAQSIKSMIRSGDSVYRYGGEEFVIVLNRCDQEQAHIVAEKIRTKIEHSHLIYTGKTIQITVSIGVTVHRKDDTFEDIFNRADSALYRAKEEGKNRTVMFE